MLHERKDDERNDNQNDDALLAFRQFENISHAVAYLIGSFTPASRKPFNRN